MTTISILRERSERDSATFRAVSGERESVGRTAGEALDALTEQLGEDEAATLVIVQLLQPDDFFPAEQQQRLSELMSRWREARECDSELPPDEQAELESLVEAEIDA